MNNFQYKTIGNNLVNVSQLIYRYFSLTPDPENILEKITFGTSGHRGSSIHCSFNEMHVLAITQAIVQQRYLQGIHGPCYLGKDTHALSEVAFISILEVLSANFVHTFIESMNSYTPTPVITNAILNYNKNICNNSLKADGIVVTSSHNPPTDGGLKYYSFHSGTANTDITDMIEKHSNIFLLNNLKGVRRLTLKQAHRSGYIHIVDFTKEYITGLTNIVNIQAIKNSGLQLGVDPMGGAGIDCWYRIAQFYNLDLTLIHEIIDPTFSFIQSDYNGVIRIDCSSKLVMHNTLKFSNKFDLIFSNDPDCDRYGIITPSGLMNSNDYLIIAIDYLFKHRPHWNKKLGVGKTLVSSTMIDKVVKKINRHVIEVPIGFKWFVNGLFYGTLGIAGEESSGGVFLKFDATPWSADKDGIIMCLLSAEISAITGKILQETYIKLIQNFNISVSSYNSIQIPICHVFQKKNLLDVLMSKKNIFSELAGDHILKTIKITKNKDKTKVDGIKFITCNGWGAFRSSGTEKTYKIYSESFMGDKHRKKIEYEIFEKIKLCLSTI